MIEGMLKTNPQVQSIVALALAEDIETGDITTNTVVPMGTTAVAEVVARADGILAGVDVAEMVMTAVDPDVRMTRLVDDGQVVTPWLPVLRLEGAAKSILIAERTILNFVMRMSGVATTTRAFVDAVVGSKTVILDTRKTTPGLRALEKYAVRMGGGRNHRPSLAGGVLIKNNHITAVGDLKEAIRRARENAPISSRIEVEVRTMEEVKRAIEAGAEILLLDHMSHEEVVEAIDYCNWKVKLEVSGNMTVQKVTDMADTGVDFISVGALTHSAPWLDFSMAFRSMDAPDVKG